MAAPEKYPPLSERRLEDDLPVVSLRGLVLMKRDANRARDREDVRVLVAAQPTRQSEVLSDLSEHAPVHDTGAMVWFDGTNVIEVG